MKFIITMNMPVRVKDKISPQQFVHQVIAEHPARSLEEFLEIANSNDFIIIEEFYKDDSGYFSVGKTMLNHAHIGKVKVAQ